MTLYCGLVWIRLLVTGRAVRLVTGCMAGSVIGRGPAVRGSLNWRLWIARLFLVDVRWVRWRRIRVSVCLVHERYLGSIGITRNGLGLCGGRQNIGGFLDSIGVECCQRNIFGLLESVCVEYV